MQNNDKQASEKESFKVCKLPQKLYDQAKTTDDINKQIYKNNN